MFKKLLKEWIIPFGIEILALFILFKYIIMFVNVPTGSMIPTIDAGSWIIASRLTPAEDLRRGDIAVFYSEEEDLLLIKRLIGLPGETVVIDADGILTVDGEVLDEPYVVNQYGIGSEFHVPEGCYLFLGDNRVNSGDARYWKNPYIPADAIDGKAVFTVWPLKDFGVLK